MNDADRAAKIAANNSEIADLSRAYMKLSQEGVRHLGTTYSLNPETTVTFARLFNGDIQGVRIGGSVTFYGDPETMARVASAFEVAADEMIARVGTK